MKRIIWLATGGTISCLRGNDGLYPAADTKQMQRMLEVTGTPCDTDIRCIMNLDSTDISLSSMEDIAAHIDKAVCDGYDGAVVTHGTDTMAYTAAYLDRALENVPVPVILTGSQRPFFDDDSDAPTNLHNALRAAAGDMSGVFVLFGSRMMFADRVTKIHTSDDEAFASPDVYADASETHIRKGNCGDYRYRTPSKKNVGIVKLSPFTDSKELVSAAELYTDGIVVEGFGAGNIPSRLTDAVRKITSEGCPVILISQCPFGKVNSDIYAVGSAAQKAGAVSADMTAEAALAHLLFS